MYKKRVSHKVKPNVAKLLKAMLLVFGLVWQSFALAQNNIIIKHGDKNYNESAGWTGSGAVKGFGGGETRWTATEGAYLIVKPEISSKGTYEVSYFKSVNKGNKNDQKIQVYHNGQLDTKIVNLASGESGWEVLGSYDFISNNEEFVTIKAGAGEGNVRFSALKFTQINKKVNSVTKPSQPPPIFAEVKPAYVKDVAIVDGFSITKNWSWSMLVPSPIAKESKTLYTKQVGATATWNPKLYSAGKVRVSVFKVVDVAGNDPKAFYELLHHKKRDTVFIDCTKGTSGWYELGIFDFDGAGNELLKLTKITPNVITRASTVKFEILNTVTGGNISVWTDIYVNANTNLDLSGVTESKIVFSDITDPEQKSLAEFLANRKIFMGKSKDSFQPLGEISSSTFARMMLRATGLRDSTSILNSLSVGNEALTEDKALQLMKSTQLLLNKNIDWIGVPQLLKLEAKDIALKTGLIAHYTTAKGTQPINRITASKLLKRFLELYLWSGPPVGENWALKFNDEFNGSSLNWDVWESQNGPSQNLLSGRWKENNVVQDGVLKMVTKKEQKGGQAWTSSHIWVKSTVFEQTYGYWEARYRYAKTPGLNQAWWLYGIHDYILGPKSFEIDINEGHYPQYINMTLHPGKNEKGENEQFTKRYETNEDLSADFHVYGLEWNEKELIYYFDGKIVDRKPVYNANLPTSPRFSTAVINWAGPVQDSMDGKSMDVDWVRVYARKP
ncbi:MAG: glycosyl hydrolase family protein [Flavobacteriales bacterium]|nr:MAG: glycosyl hydrolase family protein [Flavobacteriales bacterium]